MVPIIYIPNDRISLLVYYRNNMYHMLLMPSLIGLVIQKNSGISGNELSNQVRRLYPILRSSLFLHWELREIPKLVELLCTELVQQDLIKVKEGCYYSCLSASEAMLILGNHSLEILLCLSEVLLKLKNRESYDRKSLETDSYRSYQNLETAQYYCSVGFLDRAVFSRIISSLREEGYIDIENIVDIDNIENTLLLLSRLLADSNSPI